MALEPTTCASCVFGALQTSILTLPYNVVGSIDVYHIPHVTTLNGTATTSFETTTISQVPSSIPTVPSESDTSVSTTTFGSIPTWVVSGVTLTYPTTYIQYLAFEGAAASTSTACAETLIPSSLTLPSSTNAASFIYPEITGAATLPAGLLGYLDADGSVPSQLGGDQLIGCAAINGAVVSAASTSLTITIPANATLTELPGTSSEETTTATITSTSYSASTQTLTSETVVSTTVSAESSSAAATSIIESTTLTSIAPIPVTTEQTIVTTQTVSHQPALILNTITGAPIIPSAAAPPQSEVLASSSASSVSSAPSAASASSAVASQLLSNLFNVLGSFEAAASSPASSQALESAAPTTSAFSLAPGPYANATSAGAAPTLLPSVYPSGIVPGNASGTSTPISYTGAAQKEAARSSSLGGALGLLAAAWFL